MGEARLLRVIEPGCGALNAVAWSPDGSRLAVGGESGILSVHAVDGRPLWQEAVHSANIETVSWSPDGKCLATGTSNSDYQTLVLSANDGQVLLRKPNQYIAWALAWSPDSRRLLLACGPSQHTTAQVFVAATGEGACDLIGHQRWINCAAWSPVGNRVATGSDDHAILVWSALDGQCVQRLEGHEDQVWGLAWSRDGSQLISGAHDHTLRVWNPDSATCLHRWETSYPIGHAISWAEDVGLLCAIQGSGIGIWSSVDGRHLATIHRQGHGLLRVQFSPDGTRMAAVSFDEALCIWDVSGLAQLQQPTTAPSAATYVQRQASTVGRSAAGEGDKSAMWVPTGLEHQAAMADPRCVGAFVLEAGGKLPSVAIHPGARLLATGSGDGHVRLWELATGALRWQSQVTLPGGVVDLAFAPDGRQLASGGADASIHLWSTATGRDMGQLTGHENQVTSLSWSPVGGHLASASQDGSVRVWDIAGLCESKRLLTSEQSIWSVAWSADAASLAAGGNGLLRVWNVSSGRTAQTVETDVVWIGVAWSPDDQTLAAASSQQGDLHIRTWSGRSGDVMQAWISHERSNFATPAAWSPDGRLLASCPNWRESDGLDPDVGLRIWEAQSGRLVACLPFPEKLSWRVAWSPDGGFIATSHSNDREHIFRIWDVREFMTEAEQPGAATATTANGPTPMLPAALRPLPAALAQLAAMNLAAPLSWLVQLDALLGADGDASTEDPSAALQPLRQHPGLRALRQLRWPRPARLGLIALLLRGLPLQDWAPPAAITPSRLRQALELALAGPACPPQAPDLPVAALLVAAQAIDERQLALLTLLGPEAVATDPALPLRLARDVPKLPPMGLQQRKLLGLRLRLDEGSRVQGSGAGTEHAGITLQGDFRALLPSQLLLPPDVFESRCLRHELLFRARSGQEPPRLRPTVLLLDVTAPCFGPVEDLTRLAAHVVAATLIQRGLPVVLVTTGGAGTVQPLSRPADLLAIWTRRSLAPLQLRASLATARAMGHTLHNGALQPPAVLLLTHAWFGADETSPPDTHDLRALFVQYPRQDITPPFAARCTRWRSLPHQGGQGIEAVMGELLA